MTKQLLLLLFVGCLFITCKKDTAIVPVMNYKLGGLYVRDSSITTNGLKKLNLTPGGSYCWTTVVFGEDSNLCSGTWVQTTDSTLTWNNDVVIHFIITPVDTVPKGMWLRIKGANADSSSLFGYYY